MYTNKKIIWLFVTTLIIWWIVLMSNYGLFKASITSPEFEWKVTPPAWDSDVLISNYEARADQRGSLIIRTGVSQSWILAIGFKLRFIPSDVMFRSIIEPIWVNAEFTNINVDNINWLAEINIIASEPFNINAETDFLKLEAVINKDLIVWKTVSIDVTKVEKVDSELKIVNWKWKWWVINIISSQSLWSLLPMWAEIINNQGDTVIRFNDYLSNIWTLTLPEAIIGSPIKDWKNVGISIWSLNQWQVYTWVLNLYSWNALWELANNNIYIVWYKWTWTSLIWINQIDSSSFELQFNNNYGIYRSILENPTNYTLYYGDSQIWLNIASITYDSTKQTAVFKLRDPLMSNTRYTLIWRYVDFSSKKVISFVSNITEDPIIYSINPDFCNSTWCSTTIIWNNFANVASVFIGDSRAKINVVGDMSLNVTIPEDINTWIQDLVVVTTNNRKAILQNAFTFSSSLPNQIQVLSDESYAAPSKILNDNTMTTTLWAVVKWTAWVNDINRVVVDLRPIGWEASKEMSIATFSWDKIWFKLENVKVDKITKTSADPIKLDIVAESTKWIKSLGTISLMITNDLISSVPPEVQDTTILYNKELKQIDVSAKVSDKDWISDIDSVMANLSSLWLWYQLLYVIDGAAQPNWQVSSAATTGFATENWIPGDIWANLLSRNERQTSIFRLSSPLEVPFDKVAWKYDYKVTAYDKTWEMWEKISSFDYKGWTPPVFVSKVYSKLPDSDVTNVYAYLSRDRLPNDWVTPFELSVTLKDEDWLEDIVEVRADLTTLWRWLIWLERNPLYDSKELGKIKTWLFSATWITVDRSILVWPRYFTVIATDKQWSEATIHVQLIITDNDDLLQRPQVLVPRGYTIPSIISKTSTGFDLYVFVDNKWNKIWNVMLNLGTLVRFNGSIADSSTWTCPWQTESFVCMEMWVKEWNSGTWYKLSNLTIRNEVAPSLSPYDLEVNVIEEWWRKTTWVAKILVGDWTLPIFDNWTPKLRAAVSTAVDELQLVFSSPINPARITPSKFKITETDDISKQLPIRQVKVNATSTVVTLNTWNQEKSQKYTITANFEELWLKNSYQNDNKQDFYWFDKSSTSPQLSKIEPLSSTLLSLTFTEWIRPTSLGKNFEIFTADSKLEQLGVLNAEFGTSNNVVLISTQTQARNQKYTLRAKGLLSPSWNPVWGLQKNVKYHKWEYFGITMAFEWYSKPIPIDQRWNAFELSNAMKDNCIDFRDFTAFTQDYKRKMPSKEFFDYDYNNKIDFYDFTMFSSVYGKCSNDTQLARPQDVVSTQTWLNTGTTGLVDVKQDNFIDNNLMIKQITWAALHWVADVGTWDEVYELIVDWSQDIDTQIRNQIGEEVSYEILTWSNIINSL